MVPEITTAFENPTGFKNYEKIVNIEAFTRKLYCKVVKFFFFNFLNCIAKLILVADRMEKFPEDVYFNLKNINYVFH